MKTINIYLTKQEYGKCKILQNKYRVSLSTLADKVIFTTFKYTRTTKDNNELYKKYLQKGVKTSIKPKCLLTEIEYNLSKELDDRKRNIFATNALKIYVNKTPESYIPKDKINNYYNEINNELQKTVDPNWDYNDRLKAQIRIVKQNKEYFKKILEQ